jgi:4-diphosphocytidyl-2-C-methyl-D-erythritol kinase
VREAGCAKINLGLKVLGKREDGYHAVDMVMQTISFADYLDFTPSSKFVLTIDDPSLPTDQRNLAYKAATLISEATKNPLNVKIHINKRIFKAAGLAGGSTDAAAVLKGLNKYWQSGLTEKELEKLGEQIGSDVPFCVRGGTVRATGRGEILETLPALPKLWLVLAKPLDLDVSTAWVYKNFQKGKCINEVDMEALVQAIKKGKKDDILTSLGNDLESVTLPQYPILNSLKKTIKENGAQAVLMSGSGPTIFGVTATEKEAKKISQLVQSEYKVAVATAETVQER